MRKFFAETIFYIHWAIVFFWYSLFFVSTTWWPEKIIFHFQLTSMIVLHQFLWGFIILPWTKKYRMVCLLTTVTQVLRGKSVADKKNYERSFPIEAFDRIGFTITNRMATIITFTTLIIVTVQYFSL